MSWNVRDPLPPRDPLPKRVGDTPEDVWPTFTNYSYHGLGGYSKLINGLIVTASGVFAGADPGFFLGGGALISCSTSTPINHIVFFVAEYQLY